MKCFVHHSAYEQKIKAAFSFQCCFTSTETIRLIRDREPRMATSTFTQLLSCVSGLSRFQPATHELATWTAGGFAAACVLYFVL